jgi:hypothetical protein
MHKKLHTNVHFSVDDMTSEYVQTISRFCMIIEWDVCPVKIFPEKTESSPTIKQAMHVARIDRINNQRQRRVIFPRSLPQSG